MANCQGKDGFVMSFSDIIGHEHNIKVLQRSIDRERLHHAYIFSGPRGVGKGLTAISLAKALNCLEMDTDFCGHCRSCRKIDAGNHPDIKIVEPDGQQIKVDQIRELQKDLHYRPFEGKKRVFIIDEADRMGLSAGNSLLKTLEEPPRDSILILVTANFHALLSTVVSRCQRLNFSSLPVSSVEKVLVEKTGTDTKIVRIIASLSEGSIGRALSEDEGSVLAERDRVFSGFAGLKDKRMLDIFKTAEELAKDEDLGGILRALKVFYRDMAVLKGGGGALINSDMVSKIENEVKRTSMEAILEGFELISGTEELIKRNVNKQLALEVMMMRLAA